MYKINENYLKLPGSYLFSTIGKKVSAYTAANPDKKVIRLGIGDVTLPLAPAVIEAMHRAVDEMADAATFKGYAPDLGYEFLRSAIAQQDYKAGGVARYTIGLPFATRFTRCMSIRTPCRAGRGNMRRTKSAGRT